MSGRRIVAPLFSLFCKNIASVTSLLRQVRLFRLTSRLANKRVVGILGFLVSSPPNHEMPCASHRGFVPTTRDPIKGDPTRNPLQWQQQTSAGSFTTQQRPYSGK
jgi:hypothetical protein